MFYKHLKLLRRPEWNVDIRTVRPRQGSNIEKRVIQWMTLFSISLRARDVAERPGDVRLRRPERSVDIRTVQTRQGSNTQETCCPLDDPFILVTYPHFICIANSFSTKKRIPTLDILKKRARDGIRTRDPRLGKAILHH